MNRDLEKVYDEQIAPLMKEIIRICHENQMPMLADFQYGPNHHCTTCMPFDGDKNIHAARQLLMEGFVAFAVTHSRRSTYQ